MRGLALICGLVLAGFVWGQGAVSEGLVVDGGGAGSPVGAVAAIEGSQEEGLVGTKPDLVLPRSDLAEAGEPVVNGWQFAQMMVALGIVLFLLKVGLPKVVGIFGNRLSPSLGSEIRIEESASCGASVLHVVTVRGRTLLLGVTASGVSTLADLTVPGSVESAVAEAGEPVFFDLLDAASAQEPAAKPPVEPTVGSAVSSVVGSAVRGGAEADARAGLRRRGGDERVRNAKVKAYESAVVDAGGGVESGTRKVSAEDVRARLARLGKLIG